MGEATAARICSDQKAPLSNKEGDNGFESGCKLSLKAAWRAIAERFPELQPRLPRVRKIYMSEDERMDIFDAVSLALACFGPKAEPQPAQAAA